MTTAIWTERLTKDYGARRGLFDLDLEVVAGEIFGYLGPTGAGKTTTIRLLMDMIRPTRGRAEVFSVDCQARPVEVKRLVGYVRVSCPSSVGCAAARWSATSPACAAASVAAASSP